MMTTDSVQGDSGDRQVTFDLDALLQKIKANKKKSAIICLFALAIGNQFAPNVFSQFSSYRGEPVAFNGGNARITNETVALSMEQDKPQAQYLLTLDQSMSGWINQRANEFHGHAARFAADPEHDCAKTTMILCLRSFQETRLAEIELLKTQGLHSEIGSKLLEFQAIEVAITRLSPSQNVATSAFLEQTVTAPSVTDVPVATLTAAFNVYHNAQKGQQRLELESIEQNVATRRIENCLKEGGQQCF